MNITSYSCYLLFLILYIIIYISEGAPVDYVPNAVCATPAGLSTSPHLVHLRSHSPPSSSPHPPLILPSSSSSLFLCLPCPLCPHIDSLMQDAISTVQYGASQEYHQQVMTYTSKVMCRLQSLPTTQASHSTILGLVVIPLLPSLSS